MKTYRIPIDTSDPEIKAIWEAALRAAEEVAAWPAWKRNEQPVDEDCCVGDASRCRCSARVVAVSDEPEQTPWEDDQ